MLSTQTTQINIVQIPVVLIVPNPKQPRKRFKTDELENLTASIKEHGVIQPLIVCPAGGGGIHTLIAGERRLRAAKGASLATVSAVIRNVNPEDLGVVALIENVIRDDMSPVEEGDAYLELRQKGRICQIITTYIHTLKHHFLCRMPGMSISNGQAAKELGISISTLRPWEVEGKIQPVRTPSEHRLVCLATAGTRIVNRVRYCARRRNNYEDSARL
jgi:hypothetical protein